MIRYGEIGYERVLKYFSQYMDEWVDAWPKKIKPFDRWLESLLDKKENKGKKAEVEHKKKFCRYCGRAFDEFYIDKTKDHVIPLSKGGLDTKENRRPCCYDCNQWKDNKHPEDWMKELQRLIKNNKKIRPPYNRNMIGTMIGRIRCVMSEIRQNPKKVSMYKI